MKKILFCTVGVGKGVENAIKFSIKTNNPDKVVFVCSNDSNKTLERGLIQELEFKDAEIIPVDKEDFQEIYFQVKSRIQAFLTNDTTIQDIIVDFTSGTKAMSAGAVAAAVDLGVGTVSYITGQRNENGIVITGGECMRSTRLLKLNLERRLQLLKSFFEKRQYYACAQIIEPVIKHLELFDEDKRQEIRLQKRMIGGLIKWEQFDHYKSKTELNGFEPHHTVIEKIVSEKYSLSKKLGRKPDDTPTMSGALDLFLNSQRCAESGKYDDAIARLYRCLEMIVQFLLLTEHSIDTSNVEHKTIETVSNEEFKEQFDQNKQIHKLGLVNSFSLYAEKSPQSHITKIFKEKEDKIKKLLQLRNSSILAHGFSPITMESYQGMSEIIEEFLSEFNSKTGLKESIQKCFAKDFDSWNKTIQTHKDYLKNEITK